MLDMGDELKLEKNMELIERWVNLAPGEFSLQQIDREMGFSDEIKLHDRTLALETLANMGLIERVGAKRGFYRPVDRSLERMDYKTAKPSDMDFWLPFNIHELVDIMPKNIIIIAGEPNAGKTAFMLNVIKGNQNNYTIHYFNSEMSALELQKRLLKDENMSLDMWKFDAYFRNRDFADVIFPDDINIIDFLELYDNFYIVGGLITAIHEKLKNGLAIIAIQKNPGLDTGLGGFRTLEKARLALAMKPGTIKITKAKNFKTKENPNGKCVDFKLINGVKFVQTRDWYPSE